MTRLAETFRRLQAKDELALFPYLTAGFPDQATSVHLLQTIMEAGADGLEIGIPFSDPMADGVTLQRANERALRGGANLPTAFELAAAVRRRFDAAPIIFMSYYNPILSYGEAEFARSAANSGADAIIVPDLPPEESTALRTACDAAGLDYIFMLGPTSTPERIALVGPMARGFIYCVSLVGVTGVRSELSAGLGDFLQRVRSTSAAPLVVGFGISQPEHVRAVRAQANGVIVASALADLIERTSDSERSSALMERIRALKKATRPHGN